MTGLRVLSPGLSATVQDLGRPGHADVGVSQGGAVDRGSLRLANRILGNDEAAPAVETLLGGLRLAAEGAVTVAVTGAPLPLRLNGAQVAMRRALTLHAGDVLDLGRPAQGLWSYLAVQGGLAASRLYGSASSDPTNGLGPAPVADGDLLSVHPAAEPSTAQVDVVDTGSWGGRDRAVRVVLGPRDDWFTPEAIRDFLRTPWEVTCELNRVGMRLAGPELRRCRTGELASEGQVRGAIQVPPSGQPIVFLADHPVTGGYPVIAVVTDADLDALAQTEPGRRVRFTSQAAGWR
ncbi:biotin-dependent carboxyltransferase family protein [Calidifontibacter sp. DB0510]|uniref:Biotin-dependent carboxyltransferase family protein n=1 Tax=Metallococcus carri TaxID=1656884 RepID=A0A967EAJ7_9MICO|nr:biotin-dependent carboxyltransferase family protein [Metallococcus carri]NHN56340.1 biotin-dependent carboxyltransferase family protein [Metallococcus carri]NOP35964.1 biotin-dependent carboxyltransferase family protein [Calidifontibacter sp. DB2511S]